MASRTYNPEKKAWKGRSYKKGGERVSVLHENEKHRLDNEELAVLYFDKTQMQKHMDSGVPEEGIELLRQFYVKSALTWPSVMDELRAWRDL